MLSQLVLIIPLSTLSPGIFVFCARRQKRRQTSVDKATCMRRCTSHLKSYVFSNIPAFLPCILRMHRYLVRFLISKTNSTAVFSFQKVRTTHELYTLRHRSSYPIACISIPPIMYTMPFWYTQDEEDKRDYDMHQLAREEKVKGKKLRGKRKRKEMAREKAPGQDFRVDVGDERFAAVLEGDTRFGIDRTDTSFKVSPSLAVDEDLIN